MRPAIIIALTPLWLGLAASFFYLTFGRRMVAKERAERLAREAAAKQPNRAAD